MRNIKLKTLIIFLFLGSVTVHAQNPNELLDLAVKYENAGKLDEAREILESLHTSAPGNVVYTVRLKGLYLRMQAFEPLLRILDDEHQQNTRNPGPMIEKAQAYHRMGKRDEAIHLWKSVIQSNPKQRNVIQQVASVMSAERLYLEAIDVYLEGRKMLNEPNLWTIQLAGLYTAVQAYGETTREYLRELKQRPGQAMYVESQILKMPKADKPGRQILDVLKEALRQDGNNADLLKILSRAHLRWGNIKDGYACALLQDDLASKKLAGVALLEFAARLNEPEMLPYAEKAYLELLNRYPDYPARDQIWFFLGKNYEVRGESDKALAILDSVVLHMPGSPKAPQALMLYGQIMRDQKANYPAANRAFKQLLKDYANSSYGRRAHLELGMLQVMADSLDQAERSFTKNLQDIQPYTPIWIEASLRLAEAAYYRGDFDTALTVLKAMSQPGIKPELFQHPAMNDGLRLRQLIQTHAMRNPQVLRMLSESQLRVLQKRADQALRILDGLIAQYTDESITAYGLLERASLLKKGKMEKSGLADLDTLLSRFPESLIADQALYESGLMCEQMGENTSALQRYERFLIEYPASVYIEDVRKHIRKLDGENI